MSAQGPHAANIRGTHDEKTLQQFTTCLAAEDGAIGAMMADGHLGYSMPIGGVVGYRESISPSGVGFDIACGNMAARTNIKFGDIKGDVGRLMDRVFDEVAFGIGRKNRFAVSDRAAARWERAAYTDLGLADFQKPLVELARVQLGTVGSGNHYVDLFVDELGAVWVGVHFGSRGFGHKTTTWALGKAGATSNDMMAQPCLLKMDTALAQDYAHGVRVAGEYAYAGREAVVDYIVSEILGGCIEYEVHNHHNFVWREQHDGVWYYVHRKGATPAFDGQHGFIGATMAEQSVIVRGTGTGAELLHSTVHGAGRVLSRSQAAGKVKTRKAWSCGQRACDYTAPAREHARGEQGSLPACPACGVGKLHLNTIRDTVRAGVVDWASASGMVREKGIELRGAGPDEAPQCYKRLDAVLADQGSSIQVVARLQPIGVAMAGPDTHDPYKD